MDTSEVIRNLRCQQEKHKNDILYTAKLNISAMCRDCADCIESMQAVIKRLTAERDAVVEDMALIVESATECTVCKHRVGTCGCPIRYNACKFEWRGPQEAAR